MDSPGYIYMTFERAFLKLTNVCVKVPMNLSFRVYAPLAPASLMIKSTPELDTRGEGKAIKEHFL